MLAHTHTPTRTLKKDEDRDIIVIENCEVRHRVPPGQPLPYNHISVYVYRCAAACAGSVTVSRENRSALYQTL